MSPGGPSRTPSRAQHSWDIRNVPWTDGTGDQHDYAEAVRLWAAFHDNLSDSNSNKIHPVNRGLVLLSNLYGRAKDLCKGVLPLIQNENDGGVDIIISRVYRRDPLTVITDMHRELELLINCKHASSERFDEFERRFSAQHSKLNSMGAEAAIPEAIAALIMISNAKLDSTQSLSILAAAAPTDETLSPTSSMNTFVTSVSYDRIASVLRQCKLPASITASAVTLVNHGRQHSQPYHTGRDSSASFAERRSGGRGGNRRGGGTSSDAIRYRKCANRCAMCGKYGHWWSDHHASGQLKPGALSSESPIKPDQAAISAHEATTRQQPASQAAIEKAPGTLQFNTAVPTADDVAACAEIVGPLIDTGAPYSAIGMRELCQYAPDLLSDWDGSLDPKPEQLDKFDCWQYGSGEHASNQRRILGSIILTAYSPSGQMINIRHAVLDGSSQWVIGRNVTSKSIVDEALTKCLLLVNPNGTQTSIPLIIEPLHIYISSDSFRKGISSITACTANPSNEKTWAQRKKIIDRVHKHVCGHASISDIKTLLDRNGLFDKVAMKYLSETVQRCRSCRTTSEPKTARRVSLNSMHRQFNDLVCVDHMFLETACVMHIMDTATRYSAGLVCESTDLASAANAFETSWLSPFWPPLEVQGDAAFNHKAFTSLLEKYGTQFRASPPRRHQKNVLESKHGSIRSIFLRLRDMDADDTTAVLAQRALRISNDLYGSSTLSAFEMAMGYPRPIDNCVNPITPELIEAQQTFAAKRKIARILQSKATPIPPSISAGDLVDVYVKHEMEKRGRWLCDRTVLDFNTSSGTVTIPGVAGKPMQAAVEDVRISVPSDSISRAIQRANDELDDELHPLLVIDSETNVPISDAQNDKNFDTANLNASVEEEAFEPHFNDADSGDEVVKPPSVGERVEIFWPKDNAFYAGKVSRIRGQNHTITYDDGEIERLQLGNEIWRRPTTSVSCASASPSIQSSKAEVLKSIYVHFGNKPFALAGLQGFPSFIGIDAYRSEEANFKKTVRAIPVAAVPHDANVISSHTVYKIKVDDDDSLKLKARIAPHGNEDSLKQELRSDCCMCSPLGIRMLLSFACQNRLRISKVDVKGAFLQTGSADRDVYVLPPRESTDHGRFLWLLLVAAYGLVNANAKWQVLSDELLYELGFQPVALCPQLFSLRAGTEIRVLLAKVVDDMIMTGDENAVDIVINAIHERFTLGTISHGPGLLRFFGLNIRQQEDFSIAVDADDKLEAIEAYPLPTVRRKSPDEPLNSIEARAFASINASIGWIGITASIFSSELSSRMQQAAPTANTRTLATQATQLRGLKRLGTLSMYRPPERTSEKQLSILSFSDAGRECDTAQLSHLTGLLVGGFQRGSIFHVLAWSSHKSRRPVKSIGAAETLACGEALDDGKMIASTVSAILGVRVPLLIALDSRDLFTALSTKRNSVDKAIRADVNILRHDYELDVLHELIWVPGKLNLSDPGTKPNSPLCDALRLTLAEGMLALSYECSEHSGRGRSLG